MAKQFNLEGIGVSPEFGKDGNRLNMANSHGQFEDHSGNLIEVRGKAATHSSAFVTKSQLDSATGNDTGTVWLEYTTYPSITNFSANTPKLVPLSGGVGILKTDYTTVPSNTSWDGSDPRTYIIDVVNGLIVPNNVNKQDQTLSIEFTYEDWGSGTNTGVGGYISLVEYDSVQDGYSIHKQFRKANNDSGSGTFTVDFHTNVTTNTNGQGKGWKLYFTSLENDTNAKIYLKSVRLKSG